MMTFDEAVDKVLVDAKIPIKDLTDEKLDETVRKFEARIKEFGFTEEVRNNALVQTGMAQLGDMILQGFPTMMLFKGANYTRSMISESLAKWFYIGLMVGVLMERKNDL